jgi:hypothetical protein
LIEEYFIKLISLQKEIIGNDKTLRSFFFDFFIKNKMNLIKKVEEKVKTFEEKIKLETSENNLKIFLNYFLIYLNDYQNINKRIELVNNIKFLLNIQDSFIIYPDLLKIFTIINENKNKILKSLKKKYHYDLFLYLIKFLEKLSLKTIYLKILSFIWI